MKKLKSVNFQTQHLLGNSFLIFKNSFMQQNEGYNNLQVFLVSEIYKISKQKRVLSYQKI